MNKWINISSIYANMTLDRLQRFIQHKYHRNSKGNIENHYRAKKVNLVRYADDSIFTADTQKIAEELKFLIQDFLTIRRLQLSEEKTFITHIDAGFDFLGWIFRKFKGKLIVKPSKSIIKSLISKLYSILLKECKACTQTEAIRSLNQIIREWTNHHKHTVASHAFSKWAKHRHPNKNAWCQLHKYWHQKVNKPWLSMTEENAIIYLRTIHFIRHPNLQISKNPFLTRHIFSTGNEKSDYWIPPEKVKNSLNRMRGKLSRTVLRWGKEHNPFSLIGYTSAQFKTRLKIHHKTL